MPTTETPARLASARPLTFAAYAAFVPIGVVTVLLGPLLPVLSSRWSLNYSQAGTLFPTQFWASTGAVIVSGFLISRFGFRFAMKAGLVLIGISVAALLAGSRALGMICIAGYGAGLGLAVPAANLLVAEVNPERRSAALNTLNFCWSVGAVGCPFLVTAADRVHRIPLFLGILALFSLVVAAGVASMPASIVEPVLSNAHGKKAPKIDWTNPVLYSLAALFFFYVGTENAFGLWVASYAKSLGSLAPERALMTPSFFYIALTLGRLVAPLILRRTADITLAQAGLLVSCAGMAGLLFAHSLTTVALSSFLAGLGLSSVYPITISMLSREFGPEAPRGGSVMFTIANLGGGFLPLVVGMSSTHFGSLRVGMTVSLMGSVTLFLLYLRGWKRGVMGEPATT